MDSYLNIQSHNNKSQYRVKDIILPKKNMKKEPNNFKYIEIKWKADVLGKKLKI